MAVTSTRSETVTFIGDGLNTTIVNNAGNNPASPGQVDVITLPIGSTTITPPSGGTTPKSVTIVPPPGNVAVMTLKGIVGDTGIALHIQDPTVIGLNNPTGTFVLTVSVQIAGVRLIWA